MFSVLIAAFQEYPKLRGFFPEREDRMAAMEAVVRFYGAFDLRYGKAYALNDKIQEAVVLVESQDLTYSFIKHVLAGSYSSEYQSAMKRLTKQQRKDQPALVAELDEKEKELTLPNPHIYVDFLGVCPEVQGQGRGKKLMQAVCQYAQLRQLPIMLFTNTPEDILFYQKLGFVIVGVTQSERFQFENTYLVWYPAQETRENEGSQVKGAEHE